MASLEQADTDLTGPLPPILYLLDGAAPANPVGAVTFTARDAAGEVLASVVRTLSPGGHDAHGMESLFGPSSFTGSIEVTSTEPIVSLSLNFEADPVFSSLPPGELDAAAQ